MTAQTRLARPHLTAWVGGPVRAAGAVIAAATVITVADPAHRHVPLCPFHVLTGGWCPLCGGLRAVSSLGRLDLAAAVHDNVLLVAALPLLLGYWLDWVVRARAGLDRRAVVPGFVVAAVIVAVMFTLMRNLPIGAAFRPL